MAQIYKQIVRQFRDRVRDTIVSHPELSYAEIAKQFGVSDVTVCSIAAEFGVGRIKTGPKPRWLKQVQKEDLIHG